MPNSCFFLALIFIHAAAIRINERCGLRNRLRSSTPIKSLITDYSPISLIRNDFHTPFRLSFGFSFLHDIQFDSIDVQILYQLTSIKGSPCFFFFCNNLHIK